MNIPSGFLGTRADLLMDLALVDLVLNPLIMLYAFKLARLKKHVAHRNLQIFLFGLMIIAVVLFETDVRLSGGSTAFLSGSPLSETDFLTWFLVIHVGIALATFVSWATLLFQSRNRFLQTLPGDFSATHMRKGKVVYAGIVFTALTGIALYIMGFAL